MSQDDSTISITAQPFQGAALAYAATLALLAALLFAEFFAAFSLLQDHPTHAPGMAPKVYGLAVAGVLTLAAQGVLVFTRLVRPLRAARIRIDHLAHAVDQHSHHDELTGALNRTAFDRLIVRELDAVRRYGIGFCGMMLDVDGFRQLNERMGYEAGDRALVELAQLVKKHTRKADFLFRWRSGRLLVLASGIDQRQAQRFAEKLRDLVAGHDFQHEIRLTVSFGVTQAQSEDSPVLFIARVKAALHAAKELGPGSVSCGAELAAS